MIIVYEAKSSIDAKIAQDILSMEGINSHVMGNYLEGGIGELQPQGLVKIMTQDDDYESARAIINEWQNTSI